MARAHETGDWRARSAARRAQDAAALWRHRRRIERVAVVDRILAEYVTTTVGRPYRRHDVAPLSSAVEAAGVTWTVEGEPMVEFLADERGPGGRLVVHEIGLLEPLRRALRSRHVRIEHA